MKFTAAVLISLVFALPVEASEQTGKVTMTTSAVGGVYAFHASGTRSAKPACATDALWAIPSLSSDGFKAIFAQVVSALLSDKNVSVTGAGTCVTYSNREDVAWVNLQG